MKKHLWLISVILFYLGIICPEGFAEETIRLTNGEYKPFHSEELKHGGVVSHIIAEAFALEGVKVEWGYFPWARSLFLAKEGLWDGVAPHSRTPEREEDFYISNDVTYEEQFVFFHQKNYKFDWKTIDDLKGIIIGKTIGYMIPEAYVEAIKNGKIYVEEAPSDEINFRKLLAGRIQLFPTSVDVGYQLLHEKFTPEEITLMTYHPKSMVNAKYSLLLSKKIKKNERLIKLYDKGFKRLKESGKYDLYFEASRKGEYIIKK